MELYQPFLMQAKIHQCPAVEVLAGGQAGPGKTRALTEDAIAAARNDYQARIIIFRQTMDELLKMIDDSRRFIDGGKGGEATYNENYHRWTFHETGSYLRFDSLPLETSKFQHQTEEYDRIYVDECNHLSGATLRYLRTRMRTAVDEDDGQRRLAVFRAATNPGGQGHQHTRSRYVFPPDYDVELIARWEDAAYYATGLGWVKYPPGTRGQPGPDIVWRPDADEELEEINAGRIARGVPIAVPNTRCFIPGRLEDNPILYNNPNYEATLWELAGDDPTLYRALRYGDWNVFAGQVFMEFDQKAHVIPPIIPEPGWPKWRSFDYGFRAPFCCLWHTYNPKTDQIITYREAYKTQLNDKDICDRIKQDTPDYEGPRVGWKTVADPSMWIRQGNDHALHRAEVFEKHGVPLTPANNDRYSGKQAVHRGLALRPERDNTPGWLVTANCANLIRTLPALTYDPHKPEDVNTKEEDHAYDALRYGLLDRTSNQSGWSRGMTRAARLNKQAA